MVVFRGLSDSVRMSQQQNVWIRGSQFFKKITNGAGNYHRIDAEGNSGHAYSSYGDKRIFLEAGLLLWVLLEILTL